MTKEIERKYLLITAPFSKLHSECLDFTNLQPVNDIRFKEHLIHSSISTVYVTPRTRTREIEHTILYSIPQFRLFDDDYDVSMEDYLTDKKYLYYRNIGSPHCVLGEPQYYRTSKSGSGMVREENEVLLDYDEFNMKKMIESSDHIYTKKIRLSFNGKDNKKFALDYDKLGIKDIVIDKYLLVNKFIDMPGLGVKLFNLYDELVYEPFLRDCQGVQGPIKMEIEFKDVESAEKFNYKDHIILRNKILTEVTDNDHYGDYNIGKWKDEDFEEHIRYTSKLAEELLNVNFRKCKELAEQVSLHERD